ncbi:MAG: 1,4-dihydroxy-2-naphthoate octaprenyltransferase [Bacteroidales bacterium]
MSDIPNNPGLLQKWWISIRPYSLPASTIPVIFGTVLAVVYGEVSLNLSYALLSFTGMVVLHAASNIMNDVYDYKLGLDKVPIPVSGGIVREFISLKQAKLAYILLFILGGLIGLFLVWKTGIELLFIGLGGLLVGIFYSNSVKISLKYNAMGDIAVFLNFGILGALGAWFVQTGSLSWIPVLWATPMSVLVIAILHANNWRDISSDTKGNVITVASLLGDKKSLRYYGILIYGPFFMVLGLILFPYLFFPDFPALPFTFLITMLALPKAFQLWKKALNRKDPVKPFDFITLDGATAKLNLSFGMLSIFALILELFIF